MAGQATRTIVVAVLSLACFAAPASAATALAPADTALCHAPPAVARLLPPAACGPGRLLGGQSAPASAPDAVLATGTPAQPSGGPAGASDWGVVPTPAPHTDVWARLDGSACASPDDCWAVGWTNSGSAWLALAEHWDGSRWAPVATPAPPAGGGPYVSYGLNTVACASARDCWAGGVYLDFSDPARMRFRPLMEHWDGRSWSLVGAPSREGASVDMPLGLTCASGSDCWAVGYSFLMYGECPATGCGTYSLALHWDGHSWSRVATPDPFPGNAASAPFNSPSAVSCATGTDCWLAGYGYDGTRYGSLLAHWDGHAWAEASPPADEAATSHALLGIACSSPRACWAAGMALPVPGQPDVRQPLLERWDGKGWTDSPPAGADAGDLLAVACASASECTAVGHADDPAGDDDRTLVERWDGTAWRAEAAPSPSTAAGTMLASVSCPSAGRCVAAGAGADALGVPQPLGLTRSGGGWRATLTNFKGDASALLEGAACTGADDCWAVGYDEARFRTLTEHWDGAGWRVVAAGDDPSAGDERLYGVGCAARSDCWAVGEADLRPLIRHWDGTRWSAAASPSVPGSDQYLSGVACAAADDCWAAGTTTAGDASQALIEHWDGSSWQVAPATAAPPGSGLTALTCNAADDCWAVGFLSAGTVLRALVLHWDGTAWSASDVTSLGSSDATNLNAVACHAAADCWAVGSAGNGAETFGVLALHWDGSAWTRVPATGSGTGEDALRGVGCSAGGPCWAVGVTFAGQARRTLLEAWDGKRWAPAPQPDLGADATRNGLTGMACVRGGRDCRAVGYWTDALQVHTLAEHYPAPPALPGARNGSNGGGSSGAHAKKRLRLSVSPRRAHARRRTRFSFRVTTARGRPVRRALIRMAGHARRTGRRGRTSFAHAFAHRGRLTVRATKRGYRPAKARVRIVR
jgi:hypothetical protein